MKVYYQILLELISVFMCWSCADSHDLGCIPSANDLKYTITPTDTNANVITFAFTGENMSPYWSLQKPDGSTYVTTQRIFSMHYLMAGTYKGTIQGYGGGGIGEAKEFSFIIPDNDPRVLILTGNNNEKIWIWDYKTAGHLACGDLNHDSPNWWITAPYELVGLGAYDDEMNFSLIGANKYTLKANGSIYCNPAALSTMDPEEYPDGGTKGVAVPYDQPDGQKWSLYIKDDGKIYLSLSNKGFPSYVADPTALGAEYEVLTLSDNILYLRWKDSTNSTYWFYRFKKK